MAYGRGYDSAGDVKYLLGRASDPGLCVVPGVPAAVRDEALRIFCEDFDIPQRQMYCLRPDDELMAIYRSFVGRSSLDELPGPEPTDEELASVKTVADVIRLVARRRGERSEG